MNRFWMTTLRQHELASRPELVLNPQPCESETLTSSFGKNLSQVQTSTQSSSSQSKFAYSLRGSLRNLTWKSSPSTVDSRNRTIFNNRRRLFSQDSEPPCAKEDWSEDFHFVTREEINSFVLPTPSASTIIDDSVIVRQHTVPERIPLPLDTFGSITVELPTNYLSPLVIPDTSANRISAYTESPTPTFAEFVHITSSFPSPPTHIPEGIDPCK